MTTAKQRDPEQPRLGGEVALLMQGQPRLMWTMCCHVFYRLL